MPRQTRTVVNGGHKPQDVSGPFGWHGNNYDGIGGGAEFGFGLGTTGDMGRKDGFNGRSDVFTGGGFIGLGSEGQIGGGIGGRAAHIQAGYGSPGHGKGPLGLYGSADADSFGADAHAWVNPDKGASAGASAYIVQGSGTVGNIGHGNHDSEARFGLGAGVGAAGRLHWADEDGDGLREYGFGADIGPFSFDVKTEDPARAGLNMLTLGTGGLIADALGYEGNMTQDIGNAASSAWDWTKDTASSAWDTVSTGASNAWDATKGAASSAWDWTKDTASSVGGAISSAGSAVASFFSGW